MEKGEKGDDKAGSRKKDISWWPVSLVLIVAIISPALYIVYLNGSPNPNLPPDILLMPMQIFGITAFVVVLLFIAAIFISLGRVDREKADADRQSITWWPIVVALIVASVAPIFYVISLDMWHISNTPEILLSPLLVIGVIALLVTLSFVTVVFKTLGLTDRTQTLGLPEGSVRAVIALSLILIFMISSVFLYNQVDKSSIQVSKGVTGNMVTALLNGSPADIVYVQQVSGGPEPLYYVGRKVEVDTASQDIAKQIITTVSTLVVAVAGFYFGTKSVSTAAGAVAVSDPVIRTVTPPDGKKGDAIRFEISGKNFDLGKEGTVKLVCNQTVLPCTDLMSGPTKITCNWTVPSDAEVDSTWALVVTNEDKGEDWLDNAFTVKAA